MVSNTPSRPPSDLTVVRLFFLDNLRAFIILLVIVFHVAIGYMSPAVPWWYVVDTKQDPLFGLFVMVTDVFIMPVMFLIAGYFTVSTLRKKGTSNFWQDKFRRIVLPWIAGVLLFAPAITYMIWFSRTATPPPYLTYLSTIFFTDATFNHAHYWFLGDLAWFFALFTLAHKIRPSWFDPASGPATPGPLFFAGFCLATAIPFFAASLLMPPDTWFSRLYVISFQPSRLFINLGYFILGIIAWRNGWFQDGYRPSLRIWSGLAFLSLAAFTAYRINHLADLSLSTKAVHALLHAIFCLSFSFFLLALFQRYVNAGTGLWQKLSANSYTIYYIHQFIVLPLAYMVQKIDLPVFVKYLSVASASMILCFAASELIVRRILSIIVPKNS